MKSSRYIAAFITGHSVRHCTGLSDVQRAFQQRTLIPTENWLPYNFPYHVTTDFPEYVSLPWARLNNVIHVLASQSKAFRHRYGPHVSSVFQPYDKVILLAGSCGLELLCNLQLPQNILDKLHVFAYGPVSWKPICCASSLLVQGKSDWLSRLFWQKVDHRYPCSHMEYLTTPKTLELFDEYCSHILHTAEERS